MSYHPTERVPSWSHPMLALFRASAWFFAVTLRRWR